MIFVKPLEDESVVWWHRATLTRWIDADSCVVELDRSFNMFRKGRRCRLAKINAPERFTDEGKAATAFVNEQCPVGSDVLLYSHKDASGKYGRLEIELCIDGVNVNRALLDAGHARLVDY